MIIAGIDTSCDDTSVAILEERRILSNIVSSQVDIHQLFGGIVPEIASRKHVEIIENIYHQALEESGVSAANIDAVSVTSGPGLIGSLLVGLLFGKALSVCRDIPLICVNHIHGHALSIFLERDIDCPYISLVVSGGHTMILRIQSPLRFEVLGSTRDDAAGEAFDKTAKFLEIGYPGGKVIEEYSKKGNPHYVLFPRPMIDERNYDFSFSGLKTSLVNYVKTKGVADGEMADVLASFQEAVCDVLVKKTILAARDYGIKRIVVGGGVASNGRLREVFRDVAEKEGYEVYFSSPEFCTDNGAMIATAGLFLFKGGITAPVDARAYSRMSIGSYNYEV